MTILENSPFPIVQNATIDLFETENTLSGNGTASVQSKDARTGKLVTETVTFTYQLKRNERR